MKELSVSEMCEVTGGVIVEIILGFAFGAVCGVSAGVIADKVCDIFQ
nr:hypothetical protein [uncultured Bacteroides sp.]